MLHHADRLPYLTLVVVLYLAGNEETTLGNNVKFLSPDYWLLGDSITLQNNASVVDVFTNSPVNGNGTVQGEVHPPVSLPLGPALPAVPDFAPGTQDVTIGNNGSQTLDAGSYGALIAGNDASIVLSGGNYDFAEWVMGNNVHVTVQASAEIRIAGRLKFGSNGILSPDPASSLKAGDIRMIVTGQNGDDGSLGATPVAVQFGNNNKTTANVYAPNGTLALQNNVICTGAFIGRWVSVGNNASLTLESGW